MVSYMQRILVIIFNNVNNGEHAFRLLLEYLYHNTNLIYLQEYVTSLAQVSGKIILVT